MCRTLWSSTRESGEDKGCQNFQVRFLVPKGIARNNEWLRCFWGDFSDGCQTLVSHTPAHCRSRQKLEIPPKYRQKLEGEVVGTVVRLILCVTGVHTPYSPSKKVVGYQPISFFRNRENLSAVSPLVKRSPSWSLVSILTSSMWRGPMCSLNQWYLIA